MCKMQRIHSYNGMLSLDVEHACSTLYTVLSNFFVAKASSSDTLAFHKSKSLTKGVAEAHFREAASCLMGNKDENKEEELFSQAISLSEENEVKIDEEELLRQAIALSLEM